MDLTLNDAQREAAAKRGPGQWAAVCAAFTPDSYDALNAALDAGGVPHAARFCDDAAWADAVRGSPPGWWPLVRTLIRTPGERYTHLDLTRITRLELVQARGEPVIDPTLDLDPQDLRAFPALRALRPGGNAINLDVFPVLEHLVELDLRHMEVEGLPALANWPALRRLGVHVNAPLPDLPQITTLDASEAWSIDLSHLVRLTGVEVLNLSEIDAVRHVEALAQLPSLQRIIALGTQIASVPDGVILEG